MGEDSKCSSGSRRVSGGLEPCAQPHAICDEYQIGEQRGEGSIVRVILLGGLSALRPNGLLADPACSEPGYTRWRMFIASGATTGSGGTISRLRITRRSTKKVSTDRGLHTNFPHTSTRQIHVGEREAGQRKLLAGRRIVVGGPVCISCFGREKRRLLPVRALRVASLGRLSSLLMPVNIRNRQPIPKPTLPGASPKIPRPVRRTVATSNGMLQRFGPRYSIN